ncbi:MAG: TrkA family potassium uptake protein [Dehalococcoidales bacterium]|nr:TrkA family potassium uptake protein [Dehalococcoidales bacterium]
MKKQIVVIGLGQFGMSMATALAGLGHDVLALDRSEKEVQEVASLVTHAVQIDATNEALLKELGVGKFDIGIVGIGSRIESSVLATILLKKLGVPYIIARADSELHGSILEKIGADTVVYPERETGFRVAQGVTLTDVSDYMSLTPGYGISKLVAPPCFVGSKLSELGFVCKGKWEIAVFLIMRGDEVIINPRQSETVKPDDILIVAGSHDTLEKLLAEAKRKKEEAEKNNEKK